MKSQTNFVSLPINSIIVSKKEFNNKTVLERRNGKWKKTTFANPSILGFLFHKQAHIQYKRTWAVCSGSSVSLRHFTFNKNLRSLQHIKCFYFWLQLSLVFYYPRCIIVSTSLGSCTGRWTTGSSLHSFTPTSLRIRSFVRLSCQLSKKDRCLNSLFYFSFSFDPYNHFFSEFFTMFSWTIWEQSHSFEDPLTDPIERGTCQ